MIVCRPAPALAFPTVVVRTSSLDGERESSHDGADPAWPERAVADFDGVVDRLVAPVRRWGRRAGHSAPVCRGPGAPWRSGGI
jgi:hypothetical protein